MVKSMFVFFALIGLASVGAFSTNTGPQQFQRARLISGSTAATTYRQRLPLRASENEGEATEVSTKQDAKGNFYDDEVEPPPKEGISESMKERLKREATAGLDSEQKQTNVLLYISIGVAVLVILGGGGILY